MNTQSLENSLQLSAAEQAALQTQWQELAANYGADEQIVHSVWQTLQNNYGAVTRHYHSWGHLKALLDWAELFRPELQQLAVVRFAIWFHDVVYDTRRQNNEERSAELAQRELHRLQAPAATIEQVSALILATKQHQGEALPAELAADGRWFLDFDLAILGSDPDSYHAYCEAIRREYAWVPRPLYRRSRRQVLESFLQREQLYFTEAMRTRLEAQARQNLTAELATL